MVWYSHLFQNFPQFALIHTVKGFGIINKAEIDVFSGSRHCQKCWGRVDKGTPWLRTSGLHPEAWHTAIHGVAKSRTRLSDWTELNGTECFRKIWLALDCLFLNTFTYILAVLCGLQELSSPARDHTLRRCGVVSTGQPENSLNVFLSFFFFKVYCWGEREKGGAALSRGWEVQTIRYKIGPKDTYTVQYGEYSQCFIITIDRV